MKRAFFLSLTLIAGIAGGGCSVSQTGMASGDDGGGSPAPSCAVLHASALTQDFGMVVVGDQSPAVGIDVTNASRCASGALAAAVTGADASSFVADNGCDGQILQPGAKCTIAMHFLP